MDFPAPAVAAAVRHATSRFVDTLPITPERIASALGKDATA
jgi:CO/xanthine dehydrogenase Mo-binding subunit